jgi:hypothetical protein
MRSGGSPFLPLRPFFECFFFLLFGFPLRPLRRSSSLSSLSVLASLFESLLLLSSSLELEL